MAGAMGGSKPLSKRLREKRNHPPPGQPWVWLSRDLLESEAWRTAPINTRRVVERIMLEHMAHAGTMNGKLICTYDDFEKRGAGRRRLRASIQDAVERGLIIVTEKGRASAGEVRWPSKYALGWLPMHDGGAAPNRWKSWIPRFISPGEQMSTRESSKLAEVPVDKHPPVRMDKHPLAKPQISVIPPSGQTSTTYKISGRGSTDAATRTDAVADGAQPAKIHLPKARGKNFGPSAAGAASEPDDPRIASLSNWGVAAGKRIAVAQRKHVARCKAGAAAD